MHPAAMTISTTRIASSNHPRVPVGASNLIFNAINAPAKTTHVRTPEKPGAPGLASETWETSNLNKPVFPPSPFRQRPPCPSFAPSLWRKGGKTQPPIGPVFHLRLFIDSTPDLLRHIHYRHVFTLRLSPRHQLHHAARRLLPHIDAVRNPHQVRIFEFDARALVAVIQQ